MQTSHQMDAEVSIDGPAAIAPAVMRALLVRLPKRSMQSFCFGP
jgi:hypothetical protein